MHKKQDLSHYNGNLQWYFTMVVNIYNLLPKLYKHITEVPGDPCSLQDGHSKIESSPIS